MPPGRLSAPVSSWVDVRFGSGGDLAVTPLD
jgi:hypothetical protein